MPKITSMQFLLLNHAASQKSGSLFPLPEDIIHPPTIDRTINAMVRLGWLTVEVCNGAEATFWRKDGVKHCVSITPEGCAMVDIAEAVTSPEAYPSSIDPPTKLSQAIALLSRDGGASLEDLTKATGWLPHTTRAALTGLRKKGHVLKKEKQGRGLTRYRIVAA